MQEGSIKRYDRQVLYWGDDFQKILERSSVFIAGVGGLGCIVAEVLARAGVGHIHICDNVTIDEPDLNRQTFYTEADIGKKKVDVAKKRILEINSSISVSAHDYRIEANCPFDYSGSHVIDCLDNFSSRTILFNLLKENTYYIHGGIDAFTGQVITLLKGRTMDFSELFEGVNDKRNIPVTPDVVHILSGAICREFFNILKGSPKLLERFLIMDFENFEWSFLELY